MRKDTQERNGEVISRQLNFPSGIYSDADDMLEMENKAYGLVSKNTKKFLKEFLPELVGDGIKFRKQLVYTPAYLTKHLLNNEEWLELKKKAEEAMKDLRNFEQKIAKKVL